MLCFVRISANSKNVRENLQQIKKRPRKFTTNQETSEKIYNKSRNVRENLQQIKKRPRKFTTNQETSE